MLRAYDAAVSLLASLLLAAVALLARARRWRRCSARRAAVAPGATSAPARRRARPHPGRPAAARVPLVGGRARRADPLRRGGAAQPARGRARARQRRRRRPAGPHGLPAGRRTAADGRAARRGRPVAAGAPRPRACGRARPGARARRRVHRGRGHRQLGRRAAGGHPARLRRERRATSSRRPSARSGCWPRRVLDAADDPDRGAPLRRPDPQGVDAAGRAGHRADRAVAAHGGRAAARAVRRRRRRAGRPRRSPAAGSPRRSAGIEITVGPAVRAGGRRRPDAAGHRPDQPGGERDRVLAAGRRRCRSSRRRIGDTVEIAVTDRGIGIAPQHQTRVFERFFRVDPARSRATGGTGLGLAIVKHVLANHGGHVRLWSSPGTGSTFTMCLPGAQRRRSADRTGRGRHHRSIPEDVHDQGADRRGRGVVRRTAGVPAAQGGLQPRRSPRPDRVRSRSSTATVPTSCCSTSCCPG